MQVPCAVPCQAKISVALIRPLRTQAIDLHFNPISSRNAFFKNHPINSCACYSRTTETDDRFLKRRDNQTAQRRMGIYNKRIGDQISRPKSTIRHFIKRYEARGTNKNSPKTGRPKKISNEVLEEMIDSSHKTFHKAFQKRDYMFSKVYRWRYP